MQTLWRLHLNPDAVTKAPRNEGLFFFPTNHLTKQVSGADEALPVSMQTLWRLHLNPDAVTKAP
jgi:hypothetical protein